MSKKILTYGLALLCLNIAIAQKTVEGLTINKKGIKKSYVKELRNAIESDVLKEITSVIVLKNGALVMEEYYGTASRRTLHDTRSMTKSFTSSLIGMAIDQNHITSKDATLKDFYDLKEYDNYSPKKEEVSIENLLKMDSGFDGFDFNPSSPGNEENMYPTSDWVKFALSVPMKTFKEEELKWQYFTAGVVILGDILDKNVPEGLEEYAKTNLFDPLGIDQVRWQYTTTEVPNTAGSCQLSSLSFAKYGQLYKNKGRWKGQQIIPSEWVDASFTKHYDLRMDGLSYGYLFWNKSHFYDGKEYEAFAASGNGGNKIFVYNDLNLVIVITSIAYNKDYAHRQADTIVEEYILPAVMAKD